MATVFLIYFFALLAIYFATLWKIFQKAGRPAWEGFIPVYNLYVWLKIIERPWWWIFILFIPGINIPLLLGAMHVTTVRYFGIYSPAQTLIVIFLPHYTFFKLAFDEEQQLVGSTDWSDKKEREERKLSDHIVLTIVSFGIAEILIFILKLLGNKDKPKQKTMVKDWGDAIVFALVAASIIRMYVFEAYQIPTPSMEKTLEVGDFLFVNKVSYGSRVPNTPLSYPLVHNTFPLVHTKSYVEWWKIDYTRLPGYSDIERNDVVVFNFPAGDTAVFDPSVTGLMGHDYHALVRNKAFEFLSNSQKASVIRNGDIDEINKELEKFKPQARQFFENKYGLIHRPVDKRENYIKRCVAIHGDTLEIKNHVLYINGEEAYRPEKMQFGYNVINQTAQAFYPQEERLRENYGIEADQISNANGSANIPLTDELYGQFKSMYGKNIVKYDKPKGFYTDTAYKPYWNSYLPVYPNDPGYNWTEDNFGKMWIPEEGVTIDLTRENLPLYERIITAYEGHSLEVKDDEIIIDGVATTTYTFAMNYYWCMGDNRDRSADSRMWGFVPEDHIVGKASFIFFSRNPKQSFFSGIRWNKIFRGIE